MEPKGTRGHRNASQAEELCKHGPPKGALAGTHFPLPLLRCHHESIPSLLNYSVHVEE